MSIKAFWKDSFIQQDLHRHKMICLAILYVESLVDKTGIVNDVTAFDSNILNNWDKGNIRDNSNAVNYLVATKYLKPILRDGVRYVTVTPEALDAFHSDYFLNIYKDKIRQRNNNRWTLFFSGIVAFGVIYSIWKEDIKKFLSSTKKQPVELPQESKILDFHKMSTGQYRVETTLSKPPLSADTIK